jgi:thiamine transport system substrate-binding protein
MWVMGIYGERGFETYWDRVRRNFSTFYYSHELAYTDFLTDIAPMMFSYNTTVARINETARAGRYEAFIPLEGGFREISFVGILEGSPNIFLARRFIDFMLTREFQTLLPTMHWRYPVISSITLPESFASLPVPQNNITDIIHSRNALFADIWIETWVRIMGIE